MKIPYPATKLHLYQPTQYRAGNGTWHATFNDALIHSGRQLTWDSAAILSMLSFGYICGDRTLIKEIKRQPWLSEINPAGEPVLQSIPAHHRIWKNAKQVAETLERLLCEEVALACQGRRQIYVLLSGGLDSRVVAGIANRAYCEGKLPVKPVCITWGMQNSRDVVYAEKVAGFLRLEWTYINLGSEDLLNNTLVCAEHLGAMISPAHLQRMEWFKSADEDTIVLAGSYGDMVGRAEFSGLQLLELNHLRPANGYQLLNSQVISEASRNLASDLQALHHRAPQQPNYVTCEHEMHAHYTRGMLAQAMSLINQYCTLYQMFTHPDVYAYMWSLHPAIRTDDVYANLLKSLNPKLASLPWARTNKALRGKTEGARDDLGKQFGDYNDWITGVLYEDILRIIETSRLSETGLFQMEKIVDLCVTVKRKTLDPRYYDGYDVFIWLASVAHFMKKCNQMEIHIMAENSQPLMENPVPVSFAPIGTVKAALRDIPALYRSVKFSRRIYYKLLSVIKYPPEFQ